MGNCLFKGYNGVEVEEMIKVITTNGGVMELYAPITAECITNEFPGHAIYTSQDILTQHLLPNEHLHVGQLYYLLPLTSGAKHNTTSSNNVNYRMSYDQKNSNNNNSEKSHHQRVMVPRHKSKGVWKVKLVISPEQLGEILGQEEATQELIESVRTVAKCGINSHSVNGFSGCNKTTTSSSYASSTIAVSDQWST